MFVDRDEILIVHGVSLEKWCKRWGIDPFDVPCPDCGAALRTTLPFLYDAIRGLITEFCACGSKNRPYAMVRAGGEILDETFLAGLAQRRRAQRKRMKRAQPRKPRKPRKQGAR